MTSKFSALDKAKPKLKALKSETVKAPKPQISKDLKTQTSEAETKPLAKSKDPSYTSTTVYLKRAVYGSVKNKLTAEGGKDFSSLIEELLTDWVVK